MGCCQSEIIRLAKVERQEDFSFAGESFYAKVVDVYDGDTLRIAFYFGKKLVQYRVRMLGYNSPELRPSLDLANRGIIVEEAKADRDKLIELVMGKVVKVECGAFDKYGRILATITKLDGYNVNEYFIRKYSPMNIME